MKLSITRYCKKIAWYLTGVLRSYMISRILKIKNTDSWIKIIPNPFLVFSASKLINPLSWIKLLFIKENSYIAPPDFRIPEIPYRGHAYFDISKALSLNPGIKRLGFVFFMGIGDYFYTTTFMELLKKTYPNLAFDAYVSKNTDKNNAALTGKCIEANPNFENIYYYDGHVNEKNWKNYDYSDCYKNITADTLLLPLVWEYNVFIKSRFHSLCDTYMLNAPKQYMPSKVYADYPATQNVTALLEKIMKQFDKKAYSGIIFIQMTSRSSNYTYPHTEELIKKLIEKNYLILTVENTDIANESCIFIDIKKVNINETIKLLTVLKEKNYKLYGICIISLFMSIFSALKIPILILQHIYDKGLGNIWADNVYVITFKDYPQLPANRIFYANKDDCYSANKEQYTYTPYFIANCFNILLNRLK